MIKNKNDKRYIKSKVRLEENYFREVREKGLVGLKIQNIYRGANVHASTFFRHYRGIRGMTNEVRLEMRGEYNRMIKMIDKHGGRNRDVVYETFKFIERHGDYFETAVRINNVMMFEWMGKKIWKRMVKTRYRYGMRRIEAVYIYEVMGIMTAWIRDEKMAVEKIEQYVEYVMQISSGGMSRLSLFADKE